MGRMRSGLQTILAMLLAGVLHAAAAQTDPGVPLMGARMENQGPIESLDMAGRTVTVNGITYAFAPDFEVVRHTPDGPVAMNPFRIGPNLSVAVEAQAGVVRRLHVLDLQ